MKNKSAKDLAFDKERAKFRHQIKELTLDLDRAKIEVRRANDKLSEIARICMDYQDETNRLRRLISGDETIMTATTLCEMSERARMLSKIMHIGVIGYGDRPYLQQMFKLAEEDKEMFVAMPPRIGRSIADRLYSEYLGRWNNMDINSMHPVDTVRGAFLKEVNNERR